MPIYEYVCADCQGRFEKLQTVADSGRTVYPRCGGRKNTLQFSVFAAKAGGGDGAAAASSGGGCACGRGGCGCH
jgi:putative FmdB family regulatory protein